MDIKEPLFSEENPIRTFVNPIDDQVYFSVYDVFSLILGYRYMRSYFSRCKKRIKHFDLTWNRLVLKIPLQTNKRIRYIWGINAYNLILLIFYLEELELLPFKKMVCEIAYDRLADAKSPEEISDSLWYATPLRGSTKYDTDAQQASQKYFAKELFLAMQLSPEEYLARQKEKADKVKAAEEVIRIKSLKNSLEMHPEIALFLEKRRADIKKKGGQFRGKYIK
jgi:hypothetical protein